MKKIKEQCIVEGVVCSFLNGIETPTLKLDLYLVLDGDSRYETHKFLTYFVNKASNDEVYEDHVDVDHIYANLLCYGISTSTIDVLMEQELGTTSLSVPEKIARKVIKNSERDCELQDAFGAFWELKRINVHDLGLIKKSSIKNVKRSFKEIFKKR